MAIISVLIWCDANLKLRSNKCTFLVSTLVLRSVIVCVYSFTYWLRGIVSSSFVWIKYVLVLRHFMRYTAPLHTHYTYTNAIYSIFQSQILHFYHHRLCIVTTLKWFRNSHALERFHEVCASVSVCVWFTKTIYKSWFLPAKMNYVHLFPRHIYTECKRRRMTFVECQKYCCELLFLKFSSSSSNSSETLVCSQSQSLQVCGSVVAHCNWNDVCMYVEISKSCTNFYW